MNRVTPQLVRVVLAVPDLPVEPFTDSYVKLVFPMPGFSYDEPLDLATIRTWMPPEAWPRMRTYTVRDFVDGELTIDVVDHGSAGLAGPWAARVAPGDTVHLVGPAGRYAPSAEVAWFLLAGDESSLPAIAVTLAALPAGVPAWAFIEVAAAAEEQPLPSGATVTWLHRGARPVGAALVAAVSAFTPPPGIGEVFVHGEAGFVAELRRLVLTEWGLPRERVSTSGYWRLGSDEDSFTE